MRYHSNLTHPLINIEGGIFKFRYDFFVDFFKSIYLSNFLDYNIGKEIITNDFIELLRNCWFGSSLTKEVSKRVNKWTEEELVKIEDIVDQLENKDIKNKKEVLSGIFNIVFYINKNKKGSNTTENTELVTKIFEKNGQIENLSLINIFDNRYNIKFDFSNKILKNCYFEKYYDFWDCTFNENIYFTNCTMIKLGEKTSKKQILFNINKNVDKNCNYDNTFSNTFIQGGATDEEHKNSIRQFCKNFIHFFYTRGTLWKRNYEIQDKFTPLSIKFHTFGNINLKYNDFLIILNELNFIELTTINGVVKIGVSYEYQSEIIKHIEEGSHSIILNNLIEMIYKITRK